MRFVRGASIPHKSNPLRHRKLAYKPTYPTKRNHCIKPVLLLEVHTSNVPRSSTPISILLVQSRPRFTVKHHKRWQDTTLQNSVLAANVGCQHQRNSFAFVRTLNARTYASGPCWHEQMFLRKEILNKCLVGTTYDIDLVLVEVF